MQIKIAELPEGALTQRQLGMDEELLRILKKNNVKMITSSDAHCLENIGYKIKELNSYILNC